MVMSDIRNAKISASDTEKRRVEDIVPVLSLSSSSDGPLEARPAGASGEVATAKTSPPPPGGGVTSTGVGTPCRDPAFVTAAEEEVTPAPVARGPRVVSSMRFQPRVSLKRLRTEAL